MSNREITKGKIKEVVALENQGFKVEMIASCQYRINDEVDIYPLRDSFHNIRYNKWGRYKNVEGIKKLIKI